MPTILTTNYGFDKPTTGDTGWGPLRNTNMDDLDGELFKPRIGQSALSWGATTTVDLALARVFTGTNTAISTIAFANVPASFPNGAAVPFVRWLLILTNGGANAVTWPAAVTWLSGTAPELKAAGVDVVEFVTRDGGTTVYGRLLNGLEPWKVDSSGHLRPKTTNTYDIGTTSLKPRNVYAGTQFLAAAGTAGTPGAGFDGFGGVGLYAFVAGTGGNALGLAADGLSAMTLDMAATGVITANKKLKMGGLLGVVVANAALATTATAGFLYLPSCAGTPTGVPTAETGTVACVYDSTNNRIYVYNGAWRSVAVA